MHVLITNNLYSIALGRQAICESLSGSFSVSFHSPLCRLPSFFSISEGVCVGLGVEFGPRTGTPAQAQELRNYHSLYPPMSTSPSPLGDIPHPLVKRYEKDRYIRV